MEHGLGFCLDCPRLPRAVAEGHGTQSAAWTNHRFGEQSSGKLCDKGGRLEADLVLVEADEVLSVVDDARWPLASSAPGIAAS